MEEGNAPIVTTPVIIVGGGISGLAAAYDLAKADIPHLVIEKSPRVGGLIETHQWEGCVLEYGPDSFISQKPEALALIKEVGLEEEVIGSKDEERKTYIVRDGQLRELPEGVTMFVPTKVGPVLRSRLIGPLTKLKMGFELLRGPQSRPERSVANFVRDHFGEGALNYLAEPLLAGVYGGDPEQLSASATLPRFVEMERYEGSIAKAVLKSRASAPPSTGSMFRTLRGGLESLVQALKKDVSVRHGEVTGIERIPRTEDEPQENNWRVKVDEEWLETPEVILALPAHAAAKLLPSVDARLAELLSSIPYSSCAIVTLIFKSTDFDGKRAGSGFLVPKIERHRMLACTYMGSKFPNRVPNDKIALRCFFGGIDDAAVLDESNESLVNLALAEMDRLVGLKAKPVHSVVSRWPNSMAQYTVGHAERVLEIYAIAHELPGLYLAGNAYSGIGIPDCIRMGRSAAKKVIRARARRKTATTL